MEIGQVVPNVILGQIQAARGHFDKQSGYQNYVDATTLQMWKDSVIGDLPINIDHDISLLSEVVPTCGVITKDSLKIIDGKLVGEMVLSKESFTTKLYNVGKLIMDLIALGKDKIMFSLEGLMPVELDHEKKLAIYRPTVTTEASLVKIGAATTRITLSTRDNPEFKEKLSAEIEKSTINTNTNLGDTMSKEVAKEEVKLEAKADEKSEVKEVTKLDAGDDGVMTSLADLHAKADAHTAQLTALGAKYDALCAQLSADKATASKLAAIEEKTEAKKADKSIEVKLSVDPGNLESASGATNGGEPTDEELLKDQHKYWYAKDKDYKPRLKVLRQQKLSAKNQGR